MWRGAKLRINTGWASTMIISALLVLVLLFIAAALCEIGVTLLYFFRGENWYSEKLSSLTPDRRAETWLKHWPLWLQRPGPFQYTILSEIGNGKWESHKSVIPFLLQGSEWSSQETPGSSREASGGPCGSATVSHSYWHPMYLKVQIIHWALVPW